MRVQFLQLILVFLSSVIVFSCSSEQESQENLDNSIPDDVIFDVELGGSSRSERFLGTFDEIDSLTLDITRNFDNREVVTGFPLTRDNTSRWSGTINNLIITFSYTITGHAYKSEYQSSQQIIHNVTVQSTQSGNKFFIDGI